MTLKAHKSPWKMRPIVCCAGTSLNYMSKWLDFWLQKLKPQVKTYIRDSSDLIDKLKRLGRLTASAKLFAADANSMYTNIDTTHALDVIGKWLKGLRDNGLLPQGFPLAAVKKSMEIVMTNNLFEWGDLYFLQLLGTAMGTSAACIWATIYYAIHEMGVLLPKFSNNPFLLVRFIDNMFGSWLDDGTPNAW